MRPKLIALASQNRRVPEDGSPLYSGPLRRWSSTAHGVDTLHGIKHAQITDAANELLDIYTNRDSLGVYNDSLRWVWQQLPTVAARYAEAALLLQMADYTSAADLITNLPNDHKLSAAELIERTLLLCWISDLLSLHQQGRDVRQLTASEAAAWEALILDQYNRPAAWISNLLCFHYGICRSPLTGGDGGSKRALITNEDQTTIAGDLFSLQPNPTHTFVSFSYALKATYNNGLLRVLDASGRQMASERVQGNMGQILLDTRTWSPGLYTVQCIIDGIAAHTAKLIVE